MVGFSEAQKITAITKTFQDSYKSPFSVIVVDSLERLLGKFAVTPVGRIFTVHPTDWTYLGSRFSNPVLQVLLVLIARKPPKVSTVIHQQS